MKQLNREQMIAHLELYGWQPGAWAGDTAISRDYITVYYHANRVGRAIRGVGLHIRHEWGYLGEGALRALYELAVTYDNTR